jgi:glycosyltransferase involved in cell wall biosynthesis
MIDNVTFVIIGRNESQHLGRTFKSVLKITKNIIFVDSNSTDNSIFIAKEFGIKKIIKICSNYGTAAYSRSIGAKEVKTKYIQFLDGDETIQFGWIEKAIKKIESNIKIAAVHGYKKVFKNDNKVFFIKSDKKDWQPDYLQGAVLILTDVYEKSGGMETRIFGEEERDLYVRVKALGYEIWYIHELMASHYDWKKKSFLYVLFGPSSYAIWIPLFKAIKNHHLKSYIFVYRYLMPSLILDFASIFSILFGLKIFIISTFLFQFVELIFCVVVDRKGYFIIWKVAFLNFPRVLKVYRSQRNIEVRYIN